MIKKLKKLLSDPRTYLPMLLKRVQQPLCRLFAHAPFFMQGQMDINSRSRWYNRDMVVATGGLFPKGMAEGRRVLDLDPWDTTRRDMMILLMRSVIERGVEGDFAELGVFRGATARLMHHYCPERRLHLFDTFEGFTGRGARAEMESTGFAVLPGEFGATSVETVMKTIAPRNHNVVIHRGYFPDSVPPVLKDSVFAFVHLDADLYDPTLAGLEFFYPRLSRGGIVLIHDYNAWPGARKAIDAFAAKMALVPLPMPDKSGSAVFVK